jgi:hypothetical protein
MYPCSSVYEGSHSGHVGSVEQYQSVVGMAMACSGGDRLDDAAHVSLRIHESTGRPLKKKAPAGEGSHSSHAGFVEACHSVVGIVMAAGGGAGQDGAAQVDTTTSPAKPDPNSPAGASLPVLLAPELPLVGGAPPPSPLPPAIPLDHAIMFFSSAG